MNVPWFVAALIAGLWLVVLLLQLGDVLTVLVDSRTARDRDSPGRIARERVNELFWVIPLVALVALGIGLGLDHASHLFFDRDDSAGSPALGTLLLLGIAVIVVALAGLALAAVLATDKVSYAALRRDLLELEGERLTAPRLAQYRQRLSAVDARTRSRMRQTRAKVPPAGIVRLSTIAIGLLVIAAVIVAAAIQYSEASATLIAISVAAPVLNAVFAALGIRFALSSDRAWSRVYARQRAEVLRLLEGYDRSSRKGVAGLGDRVARALQILREQQPQ